MSTLTAPFSTRPDYRVEARGRTLDLGPNTKIMGIVNATPDSFSLDGCLTDDHQHDIAYRLALKQIRDGADIIDIGGESTRPGAQPVSVREERERVIPVIEALAQKTDIPVSIDTYKPLVAKAALDAGAAIVNIIMGTDPNPSLLRMVKDYDAAVVLMHIQGTPRTMQNNIFYRDLIGDITGLLRISIEKCLEIGIKSDKIMVDPGFGFGKTVEHNLELLDRLGEFHCLQRPILIGTSRKSFIGQVLDKGVDRRLMGTAATVAAGIIRGAHIVRVHDVKAIKDIAVMTDAIINHRSVGSKA